MEGYNVQVEHVVLCPASPYQHFLCGLIERELADGESKRTGLKGVTNTVMELRNICNHPFLVN
jgi:hypothetical protein